VYYYISCFVRKSGARSIALFFFPLAQTHLILYKIKRLMQDAINLKAIS